MERDPKVCVIMSTYNGEKYLREQVDSILSQKDVELTLCVFDDCSTDSTTEIIKEYMKENENVKLTVNEKNKNFTYNFLDALFSFRENEEYDYYAFADQDDFWLDTKIISAIKMIEETGECTMYSSNLKVVDSELKPTGDEMMHKKYKQGHYDILCKNVVTGCTIVMDKAFKNLATKHYPENIYLHDYWLAIIAHYCKNAHFVYDTCPDYILYRQHGSNLIGVNNKGEVKRMMKKLFTKTDKIKTIQNLIQVFGNLYKDEINEKDRKIIEKSGNVKRLGNRFYLTTHVKTYRPLVYFVKIMLNKY